MTSATDIRNRVIDQLLAIKDADYLMALSDMIKSSNIQRDVVALTEDQKIMLVMSDEDINAGRTIDQNTLDERDGSAMASLTLVWDKFKPDQPRERIFISSS